MIMPEDEVQLPIPSEVRDAAIADLENLAQNLTAREIATYERHYAGVQLNWRAKGKRMTMPRLPVGFVVDESVMALKTVQVPGYPKPEPWVEEPETVWGSEPADFGPRIPGSDAYWVIGAGGNAGDTKSRDGKLYRLIVIGERGHIVYVRMWVPV